LSSDEERSKADSYILNLEFDAAESDRNELQRRLREIPGTRFVIEPRPSGREFKGALFNFAGDFVQTSITVASLLGNLVPLAKLLLDMLKRKKNDEILIKTKRGAITIHSDMPVEVVVDLLKDEARIVTRKQAKQVIDDQKLKLEQAETKRRKAFLKDAIKAYEKLIKTFTKRPPLTQQWQLDKLKEYKRRLTGYRRQLASLEKREMKLSESHY